MKPFARAVVVALLLLAPTAALPQVPPHQPGTICYTPLVWCWMPRISQPGSTCFCPGPQGPILGVVN